MATGTVKARSKCPKTYRHVVWSTVVRCGLLWSALVHCGPLWCGAMINLLIRGSLQTGRQLGFKLGSNQLIRLPSMLCCSPMVLNSWQPPAESQLRCPPTPPTSTIDGPLKEFVRFSWSLKSFPLSAIFQNVKPVSGRSGSWDWMR